jgi:hypothetical protein
VKEHNRETFEVVLMSQPPPEPSPNWEVLGIWAGVILTFLLAAASAFRVFFGLVSRAELQEALKEEREAWARQLEAQRVAFAEQQQRQEGEKIRMHAENRDTARQTFERLSVVEQGVARIEGALSGRYQGIKG